MSRHVLRKDDDYEVIVGWDPPLQTYFAQVFDIKKGDEEDDDVLIIDRGFRIPRNNPFTESLAGMIKQNVDEDPISDPESLREIVKDYTEIPDNVMELLKCRK